MRRNTASQGFALALVLTLVFISLLMLVVYVSITINNAQTSGSSTRSSAGFYASEAGLNARTAKMRRIYDSQNNPAGEPPSPTNPCVGTNLGSGDLACQTSTVNGRTVTTYVAVGDEKVGKIPPGDNFENLSAFETPYTVMSTAYNASGKPEAITNVTFRSRLVPLFQFAIFFDKDLEFSNTAQLDLTGPVHSNGNIFLDSDLTLHGQVTSGNTIYQGWKSENTCSSGSMGGTAGGLHIVFGTSDVKIPCNSTRSVLVAPTDNTDSTQRLKTITPVTVPTVGDIQPRADAPFWLKADARIVAKRTVSSGVISWTPYFVNAAGSPLLNLQTATGTCAGVASVSNTFRDNREASVWDTVPYQSATSYGNSISPTPGPRSIKYLLDINVQQLLTCMQSQSSLLGLSGLDDTSDGGLVIYATLDDSSGASILTNSLSNTLPPPPSGTLNSLSATASISQTNPPIPNNYGVRFNNASSLQSNNTSNPKVKGLTLATDQAAYIVGNFNYSDSTPNAWIPAAVISDSINILSNNWANSSNCIYSYNGNNYSMARVKTQFPTATTNSFPDPENNVNKITSFVFMRSATTPQINNNYSLNSPTALLNQSLTTTNQTWQKVGTADSVGGDAKSMNPLFCRPATATTVRAAILAGTASTGDEGAIYTSYSPISGGVHNMMRFHEEWGGNGNNPIGKQQFTYTGSLVSLSTPLHAAGTFWLNKYRTYNPPYRQWAFEDRFQQDPKNLPPLTPRFVTIKQENFTRSFDQ